ncbi:MAG: PorP/SprF family type IX secretion system membrane protein, partial [Bacteroidota bacterium]
CKLLTALLVFIIILSNGVNRCFSQDIHFSQFYFSPLNLNPATAGAFNGDFRLINNYKDQWRSVTFPYKTLSVSLDMPFYKEEITDGALGFGIQFYNDRAGDLGFTTNQLNISLSANKSLNDNHNISVGLQGGYARRSIDFTKLRSINQFDGIEYHPDWLTGESSTLENFSYGDFAAGILWNFTPDKSFKINTGAAISHFNKPPQSFYDVKERSNFKLILHGRGEITLKNSAYFIPNILFLKQGPSNEINAGALVRFVLDDGSGSSGNIKGKAFSIGGNYRFDDAVIIVTVLELGSLKIGMSYDVNVSGLDNVSMGKGGFEISITLTSPNPFENYISTPKFL